MDPRRFTALNQAKASFTGWKEAQEKVVSLEAALALEIEAYSQSRRSFPEELFAELQQTRQIADRLFDAATNALRGIPSRY